MPVEIQPPELARLIDYAERPRTNDWSLRSALVRYGQPQPERTQHILDLVRRIDFALRPHMKAVEREGAALWDSLSSGTARQPADLVVELLRAMIDLDRLGDALATWAVDLSGERPDGEVDAVVARVAQRLEELGVPREERTRPPRGGRG
jgi:hypothetical protein